MRGTDLRLAAGSGAACPHCAGQASRAGWEVRHAGLRLTNRVFNFSRQYPPNQQLIILIVLVTICTATCVPRAPEKNGWLLCGIYSAVRHSHINVK